MSTTNYGCSFDDPEGIRNVSGVNLTSEQSNKSETEFELKACDNCFQMTNHIGEVCQKCKSVSSNTGCTCEGLNVCEFCDEQEKTNP